MPFATTAYAEDVDFVWAVDETAAKAVIRLGLYVHDKYGDATTLTGVNVYYTDGEYVVEAGVVKNG